MHSSRQHPTRRTFIKGLAVSALVGELGDIPAHAMENTLESSRKKLPRAAPESVGIAPAAVLAFVERVNEKVGGLHSFMLLRHGKVAAEGWWAPYAPEHPHVLFSLSKSFASTAVGLAVAEGKLTVEDKVVSFFPDSLPEKVDAHLAEMRVKHLLSMATGHDKDATGPMTGNPDGNWVKGFLSLPVEHAPGSKFVYNSAATYMCSAIVQKLVGMPIVDYLRPRLFDPIGIRGQVWETCPKGISIGGWGLSIKTEDIARFGQLYLQNGFWDGKQLIPASWVAEATKKQVSNGDPATPNDWAQGYGYQFWRCRHNLYRGDGAFGQYCIVMPEQSAVLAITSGVGDMGAVMNAAWETLLPTLNSDAAAPKDKADDLKKSLKELRVPMVAGKADAPTAKTVSGKTYRVDANEDKIESLTVKFDKNRATFVMKEDGFENTLVSGGDKFERGTMTTRGRRGNTSVDKTAVQGAWTAEDTYTMKVCFYETPFIQTIACKFAGDIVTITRKNNVGFGPTDLPTLTGKAA